MHIRVITPIITEGVTTADDFRAIAGNGVTVSHTNLDVGPASIESAFDEAFALPDLVRKAIRAQEDGVDAIVIDCMSDPGIAAAREATRIPVVPAAQSSMYATSILAENFSIVTVLEYGFSVLTRLAGQYGVLDRVKSIRSIEIPVLELESRQEQMVDLLLAESISAVRDDGAHALLFGCTGLRGAADRLRHQLSEQGYEHIPVVDPVLAAFRLAEALVGLGLTSSKRSYPQPPPKQILGYDL